jgi:long-chain acyl-CoA synthetase
LFTSGASARPKAVLSSHRAVCQAIFNIDFIGALSGMTSPKAVATLMARALAPATLTVVPLFHVSGLHAQLLTTLRNGRRLVFMHRWDPAQALRMIHDEKITQFNGAPSMVQQLMGPPASILPVARARWAAWASAAPVSRNASSRLFSACFQIRCRASASG